MIFFLQAASRDREQKQTFRLGVQKCKKIIYDCVPPKQEIFEGSVMRVRSDTFGEPFVQMKRAIVTRVSIAVCDLKDSKS